MVGNFAKIQWTANVEAPSNDRVLRLYAKGKERPQADKLIVKSEGTLWYAHFEHGHLPEPLKQKWTKVSVAIDTIKKHYANKQIEVIEESATN